MTARSRSIKTQSAPHYRYFTTSVALITTNGKFGPNVMAAEWTFQISYEPMLVAICIRDSPTLWNIRSSGVFGINIASDDQAELVNIAGGYSGTEIAKLEIPEIFDLSIGNTDLKNNSTILPLINGCVLTCECKVVSEQVVGDHSMVIGEVRSSMVDDGKSPLIYTKGKYWKLDRNKLSSGRRTTVVSQKVFDEFRNISGGDFVLKAAAAIVKDKLDEKQLFVRFADSWIIPITVPKRGTDYKKALAASLAVTLDVSSGADIQVGQIVSIKRLMLKSNDRLLRANFVVFGCKALVNSQISGEEME